MWEEWKVRSWFRNRRFAMLLHGSMRGDFQNIADVCQQARQNLLAIIRLKNLQNQQRAVLDQYREIVMKWQTRLNSKWGLRRQSSSGPIFQSSQKIYQSHSQTL
jgi:hypothetical protein